MSACAYIYQFIFWRTKFQKLSCLVAFALWWALTRPLCGTVGSSSLWNTRWIHRFVVFCGGSLLVKFRHGWSPKPGPLLCLSCLCATQTVSSFGSSRSVKLSHLLLGEPQCVWLYLLYVVVSLCLCKKKMSNPSTTTCQDVTHYFLSGGILCVCIWVLMCYSQCPISLGSSLSRCPIFRQVAHCVSDCMSCV